MASLPVAATEIERHKGFFSSLSDPLLAIGGPRFDALLFWGVPILALLFVDAWFGLALAMPTAAADRMASGLAVASTIITYAHLVAVAPRAYLNREVFESNRFKLTVIPVLLLVGLFFSPMLLAVGAVVGIFWDVHHSAMQNFGLSRIYDMKAGNGAEILRRTDLRLNWMLYVGPLLAGASLTMHLDTLKTLDGVGLSEVAKLPGLLEGHLTFISVAAIAAWTFVLGWAAFDYRRAMAQGYRVPAHKLMLIGSTGLVSLVAWGFSSPLVAFISINIYHAAQYFALVWLKEGGRMTALGKKVKPRIALDLFLCACVAVGVAYQFASTSSLKWLMAPFIACSLLHFWYDSFVWSVRKKQV